LISLWESKDASHILDMAISMGLDDWRLARLRSQLNCFTLNRNEESDKATRTGIVNAIIADCDSVLKAKPTESTAIFVKAFALRCHPRRSMWHEAIPLYDRYLAHVSEDDRHRAAAHYHLGCLLILTAKEGAERTVATARARSEYQLGLAAEERRLPFFKPQGQSSKQALSFLLAGLKANSAGLELEDLTKAETAARAAKAKAKEAKKAAKAHFKQQKSF